MNDVLDKLFSRNKRKNLSTSNGVGANGISTRTNSAESSKEWSNQTFTTQNSLESKIFNSIDLDNNFKINSSAQRLNSDSSLPNNRLSYNDSFSSGYSSTSSASSGVGEMKLDNNNNNSTNSKNNTRNSSNSEFVSYNSNNSNSSSQIVKNNLNHDLSTIREEENLSNRFSTMSSINNTTDSINPNDVMHNLQLTTYLTPTYCDYCSLLLVGLYKQGLKCQVCSQNFHKKCIPHMPKICNKKLNTMMLNKNMTQPDFDNTYTNGKQIEIEHTLIKKQIVNKNRTNLACNHCLNKITDEKYYLECKDCNINVHLKCRKDIKKNCKPTLIDDEQEHSVVDMSISPMSSSPESSSNQIKVPNKSTDEQKPIDDKSLSPIDDNDQEVFNEDMETDEPTEINSNPVSARINHHHHYQDRNKLKKRPQIALQRLSQRVKKTSGFFWSGHMYYYTNKNADCIAHYWRLDSKSITIYDSYRLERKLKEIPLETIKRANLCGLNLNNNRDENMATEQSKCLFVLVTDNEVFYCGMGNADQNSTMNVLARNFYNIFKMVYLPYNNRHNSRRSFKITAPEYEKKSIGEEYTINPQELLGSGQFGQVYGGLCRATNQPVAIKVIDKTRFKDFHAETSIFQNEITILYNVQHPGIVRLFALFDEIDHLFIVTEKMSTDMLEMILSKKPSRLTERVAKFIIYQILIALMKLHDRNIAHCDLKPENILLTENVEFPQVKICDFGYAKIIGENSFRRSMVGTPAYSPPELKQKRLYNNSIDMWSMGVIVYVSLSGTFPFEEDRDIYEQIMNSNFMFPDDPWRNVSPDAINLIEQFLQVKIDRRMSVNKALQHRWFSEDYQLYLDLLDLEKRAKINWLTTKAQEEKWNSSIHL